MAAALEPTGMLVAFDEYGAGGDWRWASLITCGTMALQFGAVFGLLRRSTPLFMTLLFATLFFWTALDLLDVDATVETLLMGAAWCWRPSASIAPAIATSRRSGISWARRCFYTACSTPSNVRPLRSRSWRLPPRSSISASSCTAGRCCSCRRSGILAYTGWFTGQHFADSVGWPIALIAFGIFMIGLSALAMRIDRLYVRQPCSSPS